MLIVFVTKTAIYLAILKRTGISFEIFPYKKSIYKNSTIFNAIYTSTTISGKFEKLAAEKLILRKMTQYKIPNALRLTTGNKEVNEHFIKSVGSILK